MCPVNGKNARMLQLVYFVQRFRTDLVSAAWSSVIKARGLCCVDLCLLLFPLALWCPSFHSLQTNDQHPSSCQVYLRMRYESLQHHLTWRKSKCLVQDYLPSKVFCSLNFISANKKDSFSTKSWIELQIFSVYLSADERLKEWLWTDRRKVRNKIV